MKLRSEIPQALLNMLMEKGGRCRFRNQLSKIARVFPSSDPFSWYRRLQEPIFFSLQKDDPDSPRVCPKISRSSSVSWPYGSISQSLRRRLHLDGKAARTFEKINHVGTEISI
jgi:hypothetical protein